MSGESLTHVAMSSAPGVADSRPADHDADLRVTRFRHQAFAGAFVDVRFEVHPLDAWARPNGDGDALLAVQGKSPRPWPRTVNIAWPDASTKRSRAASISTCSRSFTARVFEDMITGSSFSSSTTPARACRATNGRIESPPCPRQKVRAGGFVDHLVNGRLSSEHIP